MHKPVIPWMGGKRRLIDWILPKFPAHKCYVEAFCGAGSIYFAKPISDVEVINDTHNELITMYRVIKHHPEEFARQFRWALSSRQVFEWHKVTPPETLTDIQRAARFFYLQKLAFGGKVTGQNFGTAATAPPKLNLLRMEEDVTQAHLRIQNTYIENLSWEKVVEKYDCDETLHYLDPPYWQTAGYGGDFGFEHFELMAEMSRVCKGSMIISINDHPDIRKVFDGLHMEAKRITYAINDKKVSEAMELLVWNDNAHTRPKMHPQMHDMFI